MNFTKAKEKVEKSTEKRVKIITFKRRHFKKSLGTIGFGYQDMRKASKDLIKDLSCNGYDIEFEPLFLEEGSMEIELYVKK